MSIETLFGLCAAALIGIGLYGLIVLAHPLRKIIAFNVMGSKWYEFINWGWYGNVHVGGPDYLVMNIDAYKKLEPKVREALDAVAKEWPPKATAATLKGEITAIDDLKNKHKVAIYTPTEVDVAPTTEKMKPYWEAWAKQHGANGEAMLKEVRAALNR